MRLEISPSSPLADVKALLETYGVELTLSGQVVLRVPLYLLGGWGLNPVPPRAPQFSFPRIKKGLHLKMIHTGPPHRDEADTEASSERWPFHVSERMELCFTLLADDSEADQWWTFIFSAGRSYEEREGPQ